MSEDMAGVETAEKRRKAQIFMASAIKSLARIYPSNLEALAQLVENEAAAQAKNVWVILEGEKITCVGDGHGMIPWMLTADKKKLSEFAVKSVEGTLCADERIDKLVAPHSPSRRSLEWMMECIALSSKSPGQKGTRGMRGIGALAYLQYGDEAIFTTRPSLELARDYWGEELLEDENVTYRVIPFSMTRLDKGDASYSDIVFTSDPLIDPWGNPLKQGTKVEVTGLQKDGGEFKPSAVLNYFRSRFGEDIRQSRYVLTIVDRTSAQEKQLLVEPTEYRGYPILDKDIFAKHGYVFHVALFWDQQGKKGAIKVRHKGSDKFELTDIDDFKREPWDLGKLSGFIDFPTYPEEDKLWDTQKTRLLNTPQRNQWINRIKQLEEELESKITNLQEQLRRRNFDELAFELAQTTLETMRELEAFRDHVVPGLRKRTTRKEKEVLGIRRIIDIVHAKVFDEYNRGVPKIEIELWQFNNLLDKKVTGGDGSASFGKQDFGKGYRLKMVLPEGVSPLPPTEWRFELREGIQPGFRGIFRLVTGKSEPEVRRISGIHIVFQKLPPDKPYEQALHMGIIKLNEIHPDLMQTQAEGDRERRNALLSQYISAAMTEFFVQGEIDYVLLQQTLYFSRHHQKSRLLEQTTKKQKQALVRRLAKDMEED